ncbi:hypothetical protein DFP73DRAFT_529592 [Morchella snyderi]|nr:hypothetical protein DFP73DRAFT_529592 [Morchella snyderi]
MEGTATPTPSPDPLPQKSPNSPLEEPQPSPPSLKTFFCNVIPHAWTIVSVAPAVILLYLNLNGQVVGPELGRSRADTEAVLNILQYVSKALEIAMVLCLANLARQLVQSALISKKGTILALVGAEQVTASPAVLVSRGYMSALKFGLGYFTGRSSGGDPKGRGRRLGVLTISAFLLIAGLLCLSVGPSSAVLLIPGRYWFFEKNLMPIDILQQWNISSGSTLESNRSPGYPYIFLDPLDSNSKKIQDNMTAGVMWWNHTGNYWPMPEKVLGASNAYIQREPSETHKFDVLRHPVTVNSSTLLRPRSLNVGGRWVGETNFTTLMWDDVEYGGQANLTYKPTAANNPTPTFFKTTMRAVRSTTVCRRERRLSCADSSKIIPSTSNSTEWCFQPVAPNNTTSKEVLRSQDLLLLVDHRTAMLPTVDGKAGEDFLFPRFYITEGHRLQSNNLFTDSIVFVFEFKDDLIVCANTATLTSATATLSGRLYEVFGGEYHKEISYDTGTETPHPPATFLFQEGWLDYEHAGGFNVSPGGGNITAFRSKERTQRGETMNPSLLAWAKKVVNSNNQIGDTIWRPLDHSFTDKTKLEMLNRQLSENHLEALTNIIDASTVEVTVGGPWVTLLSLLNSNSQSQYTFLPTSSKSDVLIQPIQNYNNLAYSPVSVYHRLYGYSVSPTTILAMTVVTMFVVVACCGSIWQLCKGGSAEVTWSSLPEYLLLGESTATEMGRVSYRQLMKGQQERFECGVQVLRDETGNHRLIIPTAKLGEGASDTENNIGHVAQCSLGNAPDAEAL